MLKNRTGLFLKSLLSIVIISVFFACKSGEQSTSEEDEIENKKENAEKPRLETNYKKNNFVKGTVIDKSSLAGCTFIIELVNGEKIQPVNLDPEFSKHHLPIWVKYKVKNTPSTCMVGKVAIIEAVEPREE